MSETPSPEALEPTTATASSSPAHRDLPPVAADHPEIALLLRTLDESTTHWRNEMMFLMSDEFPEGWGRMEPTAEQIVWQPFPGGHSIGALLLHMAWIEIYWLHIVAAGEPSSEEHQTLLHARPPSQDAVDAVQWPTPPLQPLSWYFAQLDEIRVRTKELLRTASPDDIRIDSSNGQHISMRWLLGYVTVHDSYHGGQAVLLHLLQRATKK